MSFVDELSPLAAIADLTIAVQTLSSLGTHTDLPSRPIGPAALLPLMQSYELTAYDATCLELAIRLNLPLATLGAKLLSAARQAGVSLIVSSYAASRLR